MIRRISFSAFIVMVCFTMLVLPAKAASPTQSIPRGDDPRYIDAIQRTANLAFDPQAQALAAEYGLNLVNVTWEDTGRYYNSSVGPNISDVTIQVGYNDPADGNFQLALMPVIRYPNYSDLSADIPLDQFYLMVGNEKGTELSKVSLREYLGNFRSYLNDPNSWSGRRNSLLAERDSYALVSAQAAFLPIPTQGKAEFNPVIFNYQSYQGDPAVLTIVATREGTSATIIDNMRDAFPSGFSWGQRLFFNQSGERASFTGERLSEFSASSESNPTQGPQVGRENGLNLVLVIQVPLKQKNPMESKLGFADGMLAAAPAMEMEKSDVEAAVIGHGEVEGPFTEIDGLDIERDERFPVRVTVQFYKATSNGVVSAEDMQAIAGQIKRVYDDADYVGSLVVDGPSERPTEHDAPKVEPAGWWDAFWQRFTGNTDLTRDQALELLRDLRMRARTWMPDFKP